MFDIKNVQLKTEHQIMSQWRDKEKIVVSVVCATFNHESYIEDAITGFLMQETDFAFEIIIHDDASTDKTAYIIKCYQKLYPNIIKPIFQAENQYSKGRFKPSQYASKKAIGEYVAICEGDDYWCSPYKLEKQLTAMEHSSEINICVTPAKVQYKDTFKKDPLYFHSKDVEVIPLSLIFRNKTTIAPTCSYFIRRKAMLEIPSWFLDAPVGDFFLEVFLISETGALYLPDIMVVYRLYSEGSWTYQNIKSVERQITFHSQMLKYVKYFGEDEKYGVKESELLDYESFLLFKLSKAYLSLGQRNNSLRFLIKSIAKSKRVNLPIIKHVIKILCLPLR